MESRLIGRRWAFLGSWYREGHWWTDRARRVVPGADPPTVVFRPPDHPLRPLQGLRGPLRCLEDSLRSRWATRAGPRITHPVYPPGAPVQPAVHLAGRVHARTGTPPDTARTCTFDTLVGEPRGMGTQPLYGS